MRPDILFLLLNQHFKSLVQDFYYLTVKKILSQPNVENIHKRRINGIPSQEKVGNKPILFKKKIAVLLRYNLHAH